MRCGAGGNEHGASSGGALEERIHGADEVPIGGDIHRHRLVPVLRIDMIKRRALPNDRCITDEHVEPLVAFVERCGEAIEARIIAHVEWHERCRTAGGARRVVNFLERAHRARDSDDVRAGAGERKRGGAANAP